MTERKPRLHYAHKAFAFLPSTCFTLLTCSRLFVDFNTAYVNNVTLSQFRQCHFAFYDLAYGINVCKRTKLGVVAVASFLTVKPASIASVVRSTNRFHICYFLLRCDQILLLPFRFVTMCGAIVNINQRCFGTYTISHICTSWCA